MTKRSNSHCSPVGAENPIRERDLDFQGFTCDVKYVGNQRP